MAEEEAVEVVEDTIKSKVDEVVEVVEVGCKVDTLKLQSDLTEMKVPGGVVFTFNNTV